jgi:hypothetical protein
MINVLSDGSNIILSIEKDGREPRIVVILFNHLSFDSISPFM